jgi:hypothetical protein
MDLPADRTDNSTRLRLGIVLDTTEDACTVVGDGRRFVVPFAPPFPRPRVDRVRPGNLVAIDGNGDGSGVVLWRWFDAVVFDSSSESVSVWEPAHGSVIATRRNPQHQYRPGGRAYLSAGLPGAQWWLAGPAVDNAEDADVDRVEVEAFFSGVGWWDGPSAAQLHGS